MSDLPRIFRRISGAQEHRYNPRGPFLNGDQVYATDGRICVRMVPPDGIETVESKCPVETLAWTLPKVERLPWHRFTDELPRPTLCPECQGFKRAQCTDCNGEGVVECDLGHDHDCETCGGDGGNCVKCDGKGTIEPTFRVVRLTDDIYLDERYVRMYQAEGADAYTQQEDGGTTSLIVKITGRGWIGLLATRCATTGRDVIDARGKP